jgi:hypothetical protein
MTSPPYPKWVPQKIVKCGKCGKFTDDKRIVAPVDEIGRNLEQVILCPDCLLLWNHFYHSKGEVKMSDFTRTWSKRWKSFMSTKFTIKEKVDFT